MNHNLMPLKPPELKPKGHFSFSAIAMERMRTNSFQKMAKNKFIASVNVTFFALPAFYHLPNCKFEAIFSLQMSSTSNAHKINFGQKYLAQPNEIKNMHLV